MINQGDAEVDNKGNVKISKQRPRRGKSPMHSKE